MNASQNTTNYREVLEKDGVLVQVPIGVSMRPMLKAKRDTVIIKKLTGKLKANDVVLYQRNNGQYVLHRVIKVLPDGYIIRGDNCLRNEYNIKNKHIIGILTAFYKKDKYIDCQNNKHYLFYVNFWRSIYYIRAVFMLAHIFLSKIKHLILD